MNQCCKKEVSNEFENVLIRKTKSTCSLCNDYVLKHKEKPIAVISCEGACLRGEISRRIANEICYNLSPDKTVRICQGSAFTKQEGHRDLVKNAKKVIILEGCHVSCASRMMEGVIKNLKYQNIQTDLYADFNKNLFSINEISSSEIDRISSEGARKILKLYQKEGMEI